ncbi:MAG: TetR/AcrR family transcriptional regulator [Bacteroidales bacterium]|jgi:AcrR family transcriptional regulator|nr:TetR/AcrR family transcriptional regulator [Bacteroidales bacterium]
MSPRTPKQYEEIRKSKKKLIMETALELFANEGFHTTSVSKIAKKAGISKGLIYNYFESKEDLLAKIFHDIIDRTVDMLDPNHDAIITKKEAEGFFDRFFGVLTSNPQEWKLFYQLSVQKDVMKLLMEENMNQRTQDNQKLILNYFSQQNFKDPELAIVMFSSLVKGFTLMYAFAPEMFPDELLDKIKAKFKDMFINKEKQHKSKEIQIDEKFGFYLL